MELYTCPCASHDISDRWFPRVSGGVIGNDHAQRSLKKRRSLVPSACEGKLGNQKSVFRCNLTPVVAFCRLNWRFGPTFGVRNSHFSGGRIFKNALRTFESANWRDWNCVSAIFRWSLLSGGRKDRFDCRKRDCAWGCARRINTTWKNLQIGKHKSVRWAERTPSWFVLFDLQIFLGGVYPPSATSRTISFSFSNSFWY